MARISWWTDSDWAAEKQLVIAGLAKGGVNLHHRIEFEGVFYFATEANAREAAVWLTEEEYEVTIGPLTEGSTRWRVSAQLPTVPSEENFDYLDHHFAHIAGQLDREFFGARIWSAK
jgi:regulator of ribonuclease activity B